MKTELQPILNKTQRNNPDTVTVASGQFSSSNLEILLAIVGCH